MIWRKIVRRRAEVPVSPNIFDSRLGRYARNTQCCHTLSRGRQPRAPTAANPRIARKAQRNEPIAQAIDGIAEEAGGLAGDLERERPFGLVAAAPVYALAFTGPCACFFI